MWRLINSPRRKPTQGDPVFIVNSCENNRQKRSLNERRDTMVEVEREILVALRNENRLHRRR
jgi:hypothetical protein